MRQVVHQSRIWGHVAPPGVSVHTGGIAMQPLAEKGADANRYEKNTWLLAAPTSV